MDNRCVAKLLRRSNDDNFVRLANPELFQSAWLSLTLCEPDVMCDARWCKNTAKFKHAMISAAGSKALA